jgi:LysR family hydrogen peroxide-inducible transcriptional activator
MTINAMTLQELRYLTALADTRSFSQAASACFVTQPTLSTQLKKLEESLGVQLVERTNKKVRLTPVGEKVAERARLVLSGCDSIAELARTYSDPFVEPFRLGMISTLAPYLLPKLLPALERGLPRLKLVIQEGLTEDLVARLHLHELDCVVLALPFPGVQVAQAVLFQEPFWLICREDHVLAKKRVVGEQDLYGQNMMLLSEGHCLRDQALALCGTLSAPDLDGKNRYRATSLETLRHLVAAGFGCTLLPALALKEELAKGARVKAIPFDSEKARRTIGLIWRNGYPRTGALEQLANFIAKESSKWLAASRREKSRKSK